MHRKDLGHQQIDDHLNTRRVAQVDSVAHLERRGDNLRRRSLRFVLYLAGRVVRLDLSTPVTRLAPVNQIDTFVRSSAKASNIGTTAAAMKMIQLGTPGAKVIIIQRMSG